MLKDKMLRYGTTIAHWPYKAAFSALTLGTLQSLGNQPGTGALHGPIKQLTSSHVLCHVQQIFHKGCPTGWCFYTKQWLKRHL